MQHTCFNIDNKNKCWLSTKSDIAMILDHVDTEDWSNDC